MASAALQLVDDRTENNFEAATFEDFWILFSRREAKKDAIKAWAQMTPADQMAAIVAALEWRRIWAAQGRATHHIPLPATWLRGERWSDDIPQEFSRATSASHVAATLPEQGAKAVMPDHVKAAIAKLRAR